MQTPHVAAAMAAMPELVDGGLDLRTYRQIG
jgi:quinol monooxygenase YgiN